jgi:hypothetical protein
MRTWVKRMAVVVGTAMFFLNPNFGCIGSDDPYEYGAEEMEAAAAGRWKISGEGVALTISLRASAPPPMASLSSWIRAAHACGQRTFVRPAAACADTGQLFLEGEVVSGAPGVKVSGYFIIDSAKLYPGTLDLKLSDGRRLTAEHVEAASVSVSGRLIPVQMGPQPTVTFEREKLP